MAVISGEAATIRFGFADAPDWAPCKYAAGERGATGEKGGIEIQARIGDVFVVPAGVAHKTFLPVPRSGELAFYQPRDIAEGRAAEGGKEVERERRRFFEGVRMQGEFMMMGAYPVGKVWDFKVGGEDDREEVWGVRIPERDPVLGDSEEGLVGLWKGNGV